MSCLVAMCIHRADYEDTTGTKGYFASHSECFMGRWKPSYQFTELPSRNKISPCLNFSFYKMKYYYTFLFIG